MQPRFFFLFLEKLYSFGNARYFSSALSFHIRDEKFILEELEPLKSLFFVWRLRVCLRSSCAESDAGEGGPALGFLILLVLSVLLGAFWGGPPFLFFLFIIISFVLGWVLFWLGFLFGFVGVMGCLGFFFC